jgi:hypothetical protein
VFLKFIAVEYLYARLKFLREGLFFNLFEQTPEVVRGFVFSGPPLTGTPGLYKKHYQ